MSATVDQKTPVADAIEPHTVDDSAEFEGKVLEAKEIFHDTEDGVQFRTVSWQRATIIFLKIQFAMSILSVPGALSTLGAVGGALSIVGWQTLNTCEHQHPVAAGQGLTICQTDTAVVLGDFRNRHPECHSKTARYPSMPQNRC